MGDHGGCFLRLATRSLIVDVVVWKPETQSRLSVSSKRHLGFPDLHMPESCVWYPGDP